MQVAAAASYPLLPHSDDDGVDVYPASSDHPADHPCFGSDFGGLVRTRPALVFHPKSPNDVSTALNFASLHSLPVAPRGNGHSVHGQAQAHSGLVLNMRSLSLPLDLVRDRSGAAFADVAGGALWDELLAWSAGGYGLAPASWTDYLDLTVGGTLSNGGISGQAFLHGPQVSNVTELEVVTPDGECHVCTKDSGSDLFFAVLGGLGQFGVITRARIPLLPAPDMVKWIRVVYGRFLDYKQDAEFLVTRPESESFNYVEGFAFVNSDDPINGYGSVPLSPGCEFDPTRIPPGSGPVLYCVEVALHYQQGDNVDKRVAEMLRPLRYVRGLEFSTEVSYVDFLTRVKRAETEARANGSWNAPHPWLNLLVSSSDVVDFDRNVFRNILKDGIGGPMLVYPLVRSKWDPRTSVALPDSEIFYLVALLRFSRPYPGGPRVEDLIDENRRIVECCRSNGYDFKMYLPHYKTESEWEQHFGKEWPRFVNRKDQYDPMAILAPGQRIFDSRREN